MKTPPPSLLDPAFKYVPANSTDIRKTFARIRRTLAQREGDQSIDRTVVQISPRERKAKA